MKKKWFFLIGALGIIAVALGAVRCIPEQEVKILDPKDGSTINKREIIVSGRVSSDITVVKVKDQFAELSENGEFAIDLVYLIPGTNTITAKAYNQEGEEFLDTVEVNTEETPSPFFSFIPNVSGGAGPLEVAFSFSTDLRAPVSKVEVSFDGDSTTWEYVGDTLNPVKYTYPAEPTLIYTYPKAQITDIDGNTYIDYTVINIIPMPELEELFEAMKQELLEGDIEGALEYLQPFSREKYREIFNKLLEEDKLSTLVEILQPIEAEYVYSSMAGYILPVQVTEDGEPIIKYNEVVFTKDSSGSWKIEVF